jgi:molecular chaperone DnaK
LGIETLGSVSTKLIDRNTTIPTKKSQVFSTAADNQTSVEIHVLQGEREMAQDNKTIGRFHLSDIPPSPRGVPQIEVTFDIDANGILNVNAKDKATGKEQSIRIEASSGLSDKDIEKMVNDAKKNEGADKAKRERIDLQNQAEHLIYETEKNIKENQDKIDKADLSDLNSKVEDLKKVKDNTNLDDIRSSIEKLNATWASAASKMQNPVDSNSEKKPKNESKNPSKDKSKNDNIEDADFEVVD